MALNQGRTTKAGRGQWHGSWLHYDVEDGLPSLAVYQIVEDRDGNLWLATFGGGLCRFDRHQFTVWTIEDGLPENGVETLCLDRDGSL